VTGILLCLAGAAFCVGALWLLICHEPVVARWYYRVFPSQAVYPPEAAEAPDSVDAVHDEYERAKYFTGEEAAQPEAVPPPPVVVAGDDLRMSILMGQIERACFEYRKGVDICVDAVREPSPEVKR
jgi:hypothetical protein